MSVSVSVSVSVFEFVFEGGQRERGQVFVERYASGRRCLSPARRLSMATGMASSRP